jgi:nickel/cobalt transporter (NicO) family protein
VPNLEAILQAGTANPWLYLPAAVLLGAFHALEPGHSKSVMAAFIVAIHGTAGQAALLGLSAAVGHTIIVWMLGLLGLYLGDALILDRAEPWLILLSGILLIFLAWRMLWMTRSAGEGDHDHPHGHVHGHPHDLRHAHGHEHRHEHHGHAAASPKDAHAAAHEREIETRFKGRRVSSLEIVWFGVTGGLFPCPSALAVLLICLQLRAVSLGAAMVAAFSLGLALSLVAVGVAAALGGRAMRNRWDGFDRVAATLPYASAALVLALGLFISARGLLRLGVW